MRNMTDEQRRIIRRVREVLPDMTSVEAIHEVVCGMRVDMQQAVARARSLADFQGVWHNAPEGTAEARFAFKRWNARAEREFHCIPRPKASDSEQTKGWIRDTLKELYYNSPPGGSVRRLIIARILRSVLYQ